jgi:hypothetical protein
VVFSVATYRVGLKSCNSSTAIAGERIAVALLWEILQFVLRLSFGMSLAMLLTNSKVVTSGFFRVHLWVIMGLNVFGVLVIWTAGQEHVPAQHVSLLWLVLVNAIASYVGASIWI